MCKTARHFLEHFTLELLQIIEILLAGAFAPDGKLDQRQRAAFNQLLAFATAAVDHRCFIFNIPSEDIQKALLECEASFHRFWRAVEKAPKPAASFDPSLSCLGLGASWMFQRWQAQWKPWKLVTAWLKQQLRDPSSHLLTRQLQSRCSAFLWLPR